jgi:hypothetical protein
LVLKTIGETPRKWRFASKFTDPDRLKRLAWRAGLGKEKEAAEEMVEKVEETQKK